MKLNKKAISSGFLVALIITIASFTLIAGVIGRFMSTANEKESEILCHDSIALRAQSSLSVSGSLAKTEIKAAPILCKTIDYKLKGDREKIKKEFADKIARCWWMFGEGRYDELAGGNSFEVLPSLFGTEGKKNECFNCYHIMIDQENIEGGMIKSEELLDYMNTKDYKKRSIHCDIQKDSNCKQCEKDSDCTDNLKCYKEDNIKIGYCDKYEGINYIKYIQSYGGNGFFLPLIEEGIKGNHGYVISLLPVTKPPEKESTFWKYTKLLTGYSLISNLACSLDFCSTDDNDALRKEGITSNTKIMIKDMFEERGFTSVYLSDAKTGQVFCGSGDLAGQ